MARNNATMLMIGKDKMMARERRRAMAPENPTTATQNAALERNERICEMTEGIVEDQATTRMNMARNTTNERMADGKRTM